MSNADIVSKGQVVTMQYKLTLDDGQVVDSTEGDDSMAYLHGFNNIVPGLEQALDGQTAGADLKVSVKPEEAYGMRNEEAIQVVPREAFPPEAELKEGITFQAMDEEQNPILGTITKTAEKEVTVDFNHPLAGQKLNFEVKIVEVRAATDEEMEHGHPHGPGGHEH